MTRQRNASQWLKLVKSWKRSGETATVFGKKMGLQASALHSWRWRLRKAGLLKDEQKTPTPEQAAFVPVRVVSQERESDDEHAHDQHVEIVVDERNTVRVLPGFDDTTLRRVLDVLREKEAR
jgi:transposase-like protein